jgi:hypothetical protein
LTLLDNFNRTENPLSQGGNWQQMWGSQSYGALSTDGAYVKVNSSFSAMGYNVPFSADQEVQATVHNAGFDGAPGRGLHLFSRLTSIPATQGATSGYELATTERSGNYDAFIQLFKWVSGTQTQLGSTFGPLAYGDGDVFRLRCKGNAITVAFNGTDIIAVTDNSVTGGGYLGIQLSDATFNARYDDFSGGSLAAPPIPPSLPVPAGATGTKQRLRTTIPRGRRTIAKISPAMGYYGKLVRL